MLTDGTGAAPAAEVPVDRLPASIEAFLAELVAEFHDPLVDLGRHLRRRRSRPSGSGHQAGIAFGSIARQQL